MVKKSKSYVVWKGRVPGIYSTWREAKKQVEGFSGAKFKSFKNRTDAEVAFKSLPTNFIGKTKIKKEILAKPSGYKDTRVNADVHIYCDGACEPNPGECASGISIYIKGTLVGLYYGFYYKYSTNNVAELSSLLGALKKAQAFLELGKSVQILCDSTYAINSITKWAYGWKNQGWARKKDREVKNLDIIKEAHELYDSMKNNLVISHIKGHAGFEGNELADRMSLVGIMKKQVSLKEYGNLNVEEALKIKSKNKTSFWNKNSPVT